MTMAVALAGFAPASVTANETHADCEEDQPWVGYQTSEPARQAVEALGLPARAEACEGEQWDGQDSVAPGWNDGSGDAPACYAHALEAEHPRFSLCMDTDPNRERADVLRADPVHARGAARGTEAYAAVDAPYVLIGAAYVGACLAGGAGLEGAAECEGQAQARVGLYARDNTPENLIVRIVHSPSITPPNPTDSDCDQATYEDGAMSGDRHLCSRDNTAFGVGIALP